MDQAIEGPSREALSRGARQTMMLLLAVALIVVLQLPLAGWVFPGESLTAQVEREGVYWALTAVLVMFITLVERRPLSSVNLRRPTWKSLVFGVACGLVMVAVIAVLYIWVLPRLGSTKSVEQLSTVLALPLWFRIEIVVRAAIFEELLYRGFMIERLTELFRSRWVAAGISVVVFTSEHLGYWGWGHLLIAGFGGCVLTALYLWRRDLASNMVAHFVVDGIGFLIG
jgi:uncharacterized protein